MAAHSRLNNEAIIAVRCNGDMAAAIPFVTKCKWLWLTASKSGPARDLRAARYSSSSSCSASLANPDFLQQTLA